ncbi:MAG: ATP-binding protein [Candidatus Binatia bacterium]
MRSATSPVRPPSEPPPARRRLQLTLRLQSALLVVLSVAFIGGIHRLYLDTRILNELENELEQRALSFARHLAAESVDLILDQDFVGLQKLLISARDTGSDIAYAFVTDPTDRILVHTFDSDFPEELKLLNRYREREGYQVQRTDIFGERFRDFALPLYHGDLGVLHLGVRDKRILSRLAVVRRELTLLVFVIMVLSAAVTYVWTSFSLRPLAAITGALERFEPGRHCETIVPDRDDEIGDLAAKVNLVMTRLHHSQAQMMQTEKMVAAGLMASGIAHEINNPISGLQNCLRRIQAKPDDVRQIQEYTVLMLAAAEHVEKVVQSLLTFSRNAPKQMDVIDLRSVVTRALPLVAFRMQKNRVDLRQTVPDDPVWVYGDQAQLVQVLVNVVLNAIDAMPAGGVLQIALGCEDSHAALRVRDDGGGIASEHLSRVFEPFFTTKGVGKGTGLGLAVTHGIILDHAGHITVDSWPGAGTEVKIQLPLCPRKEASGHEAA